MAQHIHWEIFELRSPDLYPSFARPCASDDSLLERGIQLSEPFARQRSRRSLHQAHQRDRRRPLSNVTITSVHHYRFLNRSRDLPIRLLPVLVRSIEAQVSAMRTKKKFQFSHRLRRSRPIAMRQAAQDFALEERSIATERIDHAPATRENLIVTTRRALECALCTQSARCVTARRRKDDENTERWRRRRSE
jgi:hypothetical protein